MKRTWKWICDNPDKHKTCKQEGCHSINSLSRKHCVKCGSTEFQVDLANVREERFEAAKAIHDESLKFEI